MTVLEEFLDGAVASYQIEQVGEATAGWFPVVLANGADAIAGAGMVPRGSVTECRFPAREHAAHHRPRMMPETAEDAVHHAVEYGRAFAQCACPTGEESHLAVFPARASDHSSSARSACGYACERVALRRAIDPQGVT
jgi:hypothetical protein